ncbi:hypothetical protein [Olivibacter sp. XZL3]|uniref:hypothetical protein n=1 Tax=Olivibacter sp. XZL3 TaxID=1735116 RepID=UPI00106551F5|nr:hypothetical protein [Olivibacter sp. XZL3]
MDTAKNTYPAFEFPASELSAFAVTIDFFSISLKSGKIIHFQPEDVQSFYDWLVAHGIRDIQKEEKAKPAVISTSINWLGWFKLKNKTTK